MKDLLNAVQFLTIVRVPGRVATPAFGAAVFPLVGLLIGAAAVGVDSILEVLPFELRNIALVIFLAVVTGAIHYDGLADTLDALGGHTPAERLRIMADGSIGTYGVLGLVLVVAMKLSALTLLGMPNRLPTLLLAPTLARLAIVACAYRAVAAKPGGLGAAFVASLASRELTAACAGAFLIAIAVAGWLGLLALLLAIGMAAAIRVAATRRFGGITGDVLGASGEIVETVLMAVCAATWSGP